MVDESQSRKARSEKILAARGVRVSPHLPVIESASEVSLRTPHAIVERAFALYGVLLHAQGERAQNFLSEKGVWGALSPNERLFILAPPQHEEMSQFSWRSEALWVLLWSLGYVYPLGYPDTPCDDRVLSDFLADSSVRELLGRARPLSVKQLLDEADFIYRCHWAVVEADHHGQEPPGNLDPDVVYERHYALNWLLSYMNEEWDDVSTDT